MLFRRMSLNEKIAELESIVSGMVYVKDGEYVYSTHTNTFIDFCTKALEVVKQLYDLFKAKTGLELSDVELWIAIADGRVGFMDKRKFGDVVATKDHNLVIDSLKPLELALQKMEEHL